MQLHSHSDWVDPMSKVFPSLYTYFGPDSIAPAMIFSSALILVWLAVWFTVIIATGRPRAILLTFALKSLGAFALVASYLGFPFGVWLLLSSSLQVIDWTADGSAEHQKERS